MTSPGNVEYAQMEHLLVGPALRILRGRNTALDSLFYDVGCLTPPENAILGADTNPEGSILLVQPSGSQGAGIGVECFGSLEEFTSRAQRRIQVVVIAGVGSSALGTAALARNVADAVESPVAGIVSGYGAADVIGEALGGWFGFGAANQIRQSADRYLDKFAPFLSSMDENLKKGGAATVEASTSGYVEGIPDSEALVGLLNAPGFDIRLLVGHSKGCLSIANALYGMRQAKHSERFHTIAAALSIATFGAVVHLPKEITRSAQFLGQFDLLGKMNSREREEFVSVPGVSHYLNTLIPGHLPVRPRLASVLANMGYAGSGTWRKIN